jgi:hypothetical protein
MFLKCLLLLNIKEWTLRRKFIKNVEKREREKVQTVTGNYLKIPCFVFVRLSADHTPVRHFICQTIHLSEFHTTVSPFSYLFICLWPIRLHDVTNVRLLCHLHSSRPHLSVRGTFRMYVCPPTYLFIRPSNYPSTRPPHILNPPTSPSGHLAWGVSLYDLQADAHRPSSFLEPCCRNTSHFTLLSSANCSHASLECNWCRRLVSNDCGQLNFNRVLIIVKTGPAVLLHWAKARRIQSVLSASRPSHCFIHSIIGAKLRVQSSPFPKRKLKPLRWQQLSAV